MLLDLRGDLVEAAINLCSVAEVDPDRIAFLDLREKRRPCGFNPLCGAGDPYFRALNVLQVLESESDSWGVQLAESLRNCLMLLAEAGEPLTRLEDLFSAEEFRDRCLEKSRTESVQQFWARFAELSRDRQMAMVWPVVNKVSTLFATETLRYILGHPAPIDIRRGLNTPGSIFLISLAVDELHGAARMLGSLVLSAISREIFSRAGDPSAKRNPVRVYVDEFEHFVADFETILAEGRRFGLSLVLAHQTLAQLTPKMRSLVLNNVGVKLAFRCGRDDAVHLSRDMTGDPNAVDLRDLPPGQALLWVRGFAAELVELNEPLRGIRRTQHGTRYRAALIQSNADARHAITPCRDVQRTKAKQGIAKQPVLRASQALEDWLC